MRSIHPLRVSVAAIAIAAIAGTLGGCSAGVVSDVTTLNFFQFKGEAREDFDAIIRKFEAENPDIRVVQNQVADADTIIRTLLVKDKAPDVITLNGSGSFGRLAQAGVFYDFSNEPVLDTIQPAVQDILANLGNKEGEVNSLGYVNNVNGIIYNADIFAEQGIQVPETWDELVAACETLKAAGIPPIYATLADSWTSVPAFTGLGAYAVQDGFFDEMRAEGENVGPDSAASFEHDLAEPLHRELQLYSYAQEGYRGATYDEGNAAFARGEAAMLLQGIWALNGIKQVNPDINAAIFPYPTDAEHDRKIVSGVDVTVTMGRDTPHRDEALRFIEFMFRPDVIEEFAASQNMIPSVDGAQLSEDLALQSVKPFFDDGRITGFLDHQIPSSIPVAEYIQESIFTGDADAALATLDNEWRKIAARTIPVAEDGQ